MTMPGSLTRHEQRKATTHQSLIDAARDAIAARGYSAVDILDITERANVSKATFYKHFANKEACVRELMQCGFDALVKQIMSVEMPAQGSAAWIESSFEQVFAWADANREFLLIMVGGAASSRLNAFGRSYMAEIVERTIVSDFASAAFALRFPPEIVAQIVTGIAIQLLGWWLERDTGYSAADMGRFMRDVFQHGIGYAAD